MRTSASFLALLLTVVAALAIWLSGPFPVRLAAALLLAFFLPGWLLLRLINVNSDDWLEQGVLAVGVSYGLTIVAALIGLYGVGHLSTPLLVIVLSLLSLLLAAAGWRRAGRVSASRWPTRTDIVYFLVPVGMAAYFSLVNLGYSDYMGDEMNGLLRAISIIQGRPETLFEHTKGPAEVLLPAIFGLLAGRFEPFTVRLPFALAHIAGTAAFYVLGRHLFNRNIGLLAAILLVINGLYLAFGRIVQYQAVVFLMTSLAILLAYRFFTHGRSQELALSSFLIGIGLLAHYDMLLVLPPVGYLVWRRYGWRWSAWKREWTGWLGAGALLVAVSALFYLPFLLHPHLSRTSSYLGRVVGTSNWPGNNFDELYLFAVMYNSRYYVAFVALLGLGLVAVDLVRLLRQERRNRWLWLTIVIFLSANLLLALPGRVTFVPVLFSMLLFLLLIMFAPVGVERTMVYIWLAVSFVGYIFFVDRPRTHLQIIYPPWSLLVALAGLNLVLTLRSRFAAVRRPWVTAAGITILVFLLGLFAAYQYLLFVDIQREYIFTYPVHKSSLYWEDEQFPFGSRRLYGAPHRLGWQMINQLYRQGDLRGDWDSNDQGTNLFWYTLGAPRNPCYPRYYFLTQFEQQDDETTPPPNLAEMGYVLLGQVWNRDRLQLEVYEFGPGGAAKDLTVWPEPSSYRTDLRPQDFETWPYEQDQTTLADVTQQLLPPPRFKPSPAALVEIAAHYQDPRINQVRDTVALVGYELDQSWNAPGGAILLTLYWQAVDVVNLPYKIFTHLESPTGKPVAQADNLPACGSQPTQRWQVGQIVADRHLLKLPADLPPGDYVVQVGLYEPETGLRMDLLDSLGNPQGVSFELTTVTIPASNQGF